jgi:hypothetical protein
MKRAMIAGLALLASSFTPVEPPELISAANAQPAPSPCAATNKLGPGFQWGSAYIVPGPYDYRIDFGPVQGEEGLFATITARSPLTVRCSVLSGHEKVVGKYGTSELRHGETLVELVCDEQGLTEAGLLLGVKEENVCFAGGSWDNR